MKTKQYLLLGLLVSCALPHTTRPLPYKTVLTLVAFAGLTWNTKQKLEAEAKEGKTQSPLFHLNPYADAAFVTLSEGAGYVKAQAEKARKTIPSYVDEVVTKLHDGIHSKTTEQPVATETPVITEKVDAEQALNELNVASQPVVETPVTEATPVTTTEESNK